MGERKAERTLGESFENGAFLRKDIRYSIAVNSEHLCSFAVDILKYFHGKPFGYDIWNFYSTSKSALVMKGISGELKYA